MSELDFAPPLISTANAKIDILWCDSSTGNVAIWFMNGLQVASTASLASVTSDWHIQGINAD
jgi:hypothetical protein